MLIANPAGRLGLAIQLVRALPLLEKVILVILVLIAAVKVLTLGVIAGAIIITLILTTAVSVPKSLVAVIV